MKVEAARADRSVRDIVDEALGAWLESAEDAEDRESATAALAEGPILGLGDEPRPPTSSKPARSELWRVRVGQLRIIYAIDDEAGLVVVVRVARRSESTHRRVR